MDDSMTTWVFNNNVNKHRGVWHKAAAPLEWETVPAKVVDTQDDEPRFLLGSALARAGVLDADTVARRALQRTPALRAALAGPPADPFRSWRDGYNAGLKAADDRHTGLQVGAAPPAERCGWTWNDREQEWRYAGEGPQCVHPHYGHARHEVSAAPPVTPQHGEHPDHACGQAPCPHIEVGAAPPEPPKRVPCRHDYYGCDECNAMRVAPPRRDGE